MKYILPIIALSICVVSCEKKQPSRACYYCVQRDSTTSNIPKLASASTYVSAANVCDITSDQKGVYEKINTHDDTLYNQNDTVVVKHARTACTFNY